MNTEQPSSVVTLPTISPTERIVRVLNDVSQSYSDGGWRGKVDKDTMLTRLETALRDTVLYMDRLDRLVSDESPHSEFQQEITAFTSALKEHVANILDGTEVRRERAHSR